MREISFITAKTIFAKYNVLEHAKDPVDVGGARRVWMELESPPKDRAFLRWLRSRIAKGMRLKLRPEKDLIQTDSPFVELIPNLKMMELGYNSDTLKTTADIYGNFLDRAFLDHYIGKFDLVISTDTLEHIPQPFTFCEHLVEIAKPGSYIYVSTVFSYLYHPAPEDYFRYSPKGIEELFKTLNVRMIETGWEEKEIGVYGLFQKL